MKVIVRQGDVLDEAADVLICTANPMFRMSGGVNGALLARGGEGVQTELDAHLAGLNNPHVDRGTVVRTGPGPLAVKHILHAVGVNIFYESSVELIRGVLSAALREASTLGCRTVVTPALATGYGPLTMSQFGSALSAAAVEKYPGIEEFRAILRHPEDVSEVLKSLRSAGIQGIIPRGE